jgi:acyl-coenzyme A thioesterase 13
MPPQPTHNPTAQGHGENLSYAIRNHLDGLPELGDSSLIRGNAPASTKRLVKNVFDAYGLGKAGCFASSVGEFVQLVEVSAKGYNQHQESVGPKERLEASTVAEVVVSTGTFRWAMGPHLAYACGNCRDAQRSRYLTWWMYCLSHRRVGSTCQSPMGNDRGFYLRFNSCCSTPLVALGHIQGKNGLGVTQNLNINYHAPVSLCVCFHLSFLPFVLMSLLILRPGLYGI